MCGRIIDAASLAGLRARVRGEMSLARMAHTEGVARAAALMAASYAPDLSGDIEAAAYLHDITKEYSLEKQLKICRDFGIIPRDDESGAPAVLHAITAAAIIPARYPDFARPGVIAAVRWHTTGRAGMSLSEKIIFLADYIEEGRRYPECAAVREFFKSADTAGAGEAGSVTRLDAAILMALDATLNRLRRCGGVINSDTLAAREEIASQINK